MTFTANHRESVGTLPPASTRFLPTHLRAIVLIAMAFLVGCAQPDRSSPAVNLTAHPSCCVAYYRDNDDRRDRREMGIAVWEDGFVVTMGKSNNGALVGNGRAPKKDVVDLVDVFRQSSLARRPARSFGVPDGPSYVLYVRMNQQVFVNYWDEITSPLWGGFTYSDDARFQEFYEFAVDWWRVQMLLMRIGFSGIDRVEDPDEWKEIVGRTGATDVDALFVWLRQLPRKSINDGRPGPS